MPKPPKSPLEKPTSGHSRRPSNPRRTSSDKKSSSSSSAGKHGVKDSSSHALTNKTPVVMTTLSPASAQTIMGAKQSFPAAHSDLRSRKESTRKDTHSENPEESQEAEDSSVAGLDAYDKGQDQNRKPSPPSGSPDAKTSPAEEVGRLRDAVNAQLRLSQQRDKLNRQLPDRDHRASQGTANIKSRVSPIHEEESVQSPSLEAAFASPIPTGMETASTESAKTVRGVETPAALTARTPSYPFPSMQTPKQTSFNGHRPFTALSPTTGPAPYGDIGFDGPRDSIMPGPLTPVSALTFQPPESFASRDDPNFPSPNLYDLTLMLSAEPGLESWWSTVVSIMRDVYKAERVTLAIPADSTDIENVPWGQKATYNAVQEDELSITYLPRGSSLVASSGGTNETSTSEETNEDDLPAFLLPQETIRPGLVSRHSFTTIEDTKRGPATRPEGSRASALRREPLSRSRSYLSSRPDQIPRTVTLQNAQLSLQSLEEHLAYEEAHQVPAAHWENAAASARNTEGRLFPVLQALDYEADPLIDSSGVIRVLERGRVIALTRDYPYLDGKENEASDGSKASSRSTKPAESSERSRKAKQPDLGARIPSFTGSKATRNSSGRSTRSTASNEKSKTTTAQDDLQSAATRYEEYEQAPPSPWSQSPAPSPAIHAEPTENPFFANAVVDEDSFNPTRAPQDYSSSQPVEAIGIDRSCTVLHIPLSHVLLSKPVQSFRLDAAAMESRSAVRGKNLTQSQQEAAENQKLPEPDQAKAKQMPIAILSIISPIIPYPANLRHSLAHLAPHLATSFSLCRHHSNLETEIAGLSRKRPNTAGFGAVASGGRLKNFTQFPGEENLQRTTADTLTSPSDYSGISRSTADSPGWDPGSVGLSVDRRSTGGSPGYFAGDGYFNSRSRPGITRADTGSAASITGSRHTSKELSFSDSRNALENVGPALDQRENIETPKNKVDQIQVPGDQTNSASQSKQVRTGRLPIDTSVESSETRDVSPSRQQLDSPLSPRRQAMRTASTQGSVRGERTHTQLHSYGADIGSTFPSLPTTNAAPPTPLRTGSMSEQVMEMAPPSDRLKTLMLDSLPAHLFVALPQTGEIVWVNNRYLTYRGQTVQELHESPWMSVHPDEREGFLKNWTHAIRTGEQFSMQVRIRRFDGNYRWFYTRAVGGRDTRGVIVQWYGSYMDIHEQHVAEVKAARQEEIEASEAKHRLLANLIPQIIFAATEDEGVTFANEQWLSYTGQAFDDALGLGFMDFVHPDDLAKCHIPTDRPPTPTGPRSPKSKKRNAPDRVSSESSSGGKSSSTNSSTVSDAPTDATIKGSKMKGKHQALSRNNSSSSESMYEMPSADLSELARNGIVKVTTDSNGRLSYTTEVRLRSKTGEYRWHLVRCVEVDNINFGSGDGSWFGACTDINDHKLLETKLKEAMESKTKFLSNMSHEIRTPLIGISGMVSFLQDTVLNEEQLDYTNTILTSANSLLMIINDILDLSKVDAGMMKLSYEWFHTRSVIEDVNELVSTMAISKRLELNYVVDEDVPSMVKGDRVRIRQVLLNVIGNAIKFTQEGEVFSRCRVYQNKSNDLAENEIMLEYSIIDTGPGFTKQESELIFKPFSQIDGSSTRSHGGSGLGLVISRQLVELHGGKMHGSAVPGKGSIFTFTAKFNLPTEYDHPDPPMTPALSHSLSSRSSVSVEVTAQALKSAGGNPMLAQKLVQSLPLSSPRLDSNAESPAVLSSASSDPSIRSIITQRTERSSASSINQGLQPFSEAARLSAENLTKMRLALPERGSSGTTPTNHSSSQEASSSSTDLKQFRPPMYSILVICPQNHSREATTKHIEMTLPKDVPHQITPLASVLESQKLIGGDDPVFFTHIVLNLSSAEEIIAMMDQIFSSASLPQTSIVILSDPVQRQAVMRLSPVYDYDQLAKDNRVNFIYKPVKPSRFAVIFDPDKERDLSTDRNRSSAQQQVATQKQNYLDVEKRLGNKGHKVLLVEDNLVNQKVLLKFLSKVGILVEIAADGMECTDKVFTQGHGFFSLILCDLHMPRKDGYQTCRDIRAWEKRNNYTAMPIIALSANVMADVLDKCVAAGFNSYVTKPVDFKVLSNAMSALLDPVNPNKPHELMQSRS